jgi:hypothetical protein
MDIGTDMADVLEIWADTGETVERDFTAEELEQREADSAAHAAAVAEQEAAAAARAAALESAKAKLALLGLDEVEVAAIVGGSA